MSIEMPIDPTIWELLYLPDVIENDSVVITDGQDDVLEVFHAGRATVKRTPEEAARIAEFIILACRSHGRLTKSLRELLDILKPYPAEKGRHRIDRAMQIACALLEEIGA